MEHTFLGWEKPCLQAMADLLIRRYRECPELAWAAPAIDPFALLFTT